MAIEGFDLYQVSVWMLEKLKHGCQWNVFTSAKDISNPEDWNEVKWHFRRGLVLESESQEDIIRVLAEGKYSNKLSLELGWGFLHFYLSADWQAYNEEWQHRNQFEDSGDRFPLLSRHPANNLLLVDAFTTGTYMPFDPYISYYTPNDVQKLSLAVLTVFQEDFESRLNQIQCLGKDVTIYRGNREHYFNQYFNEFASFYKDAATAGKAVILQAIC